jgi:hypothetical protein
MIEKVKNVLYLGENLNSSGSDLDVASTDFWLDFG